MTTADDAAHDLAELMLRMRIEVRKLAYNSTGNVENESWMLVYENIRQYEDAQVRDMLEDRGRNRRRARRIRRDDQKAKAVPTERRRKSKKNRPMRKGFSSGPKPGT
jgi:hypothetical protein